VSYTPMQLAEAYLETGELNLALAALDEHLTAFPQDDSARRLRVQVLRDFPEGIATALADLDALAEPNASDYGVRGSILLGQGDVLGAAAAYERAWTLSPVGYAEFYFRVLKDLGQYERALVVLDSLPQAWHWHQAHGEVDALRGDLPTALAHFTQAAAKLSALIAVAKDKRLLIAMQANLLLKRADAYRRSGRYAQADADYQAAEAAEPGDAAIPFNRGLVRFEQGDLDAAVRLCRDGWSRANADMRAAMRAELTTDARYQPLVDALDL